LPNRRLSELVVAGAELRRDAPVRALAARADAVQPGDALWLTERAGHNAQRFADEAQRRGASALVLVGKVAVQSPLPVLHLPSWRIAAKALRRWFGTDGEDVPRWIAIVGTDGKTSVAWYLREGLQRAFGAAWARGTLGLVRAPNAIEPSPNTTPSMLELHALWARAKAEGVPWIVLEASSHGIEQRRVEGLRFAGCVFTTLGRDHAEDHGGVVRTWAIKAGFVHRVAQQGVVVGNAGHAEVRARLPHGAWRYGPEGCDIADLRWRCTAKGVELFVRKVRIALHEVPSGAIHAENLAAAATALVAIAGVDATRLSRLLDRMPPPPGRIEEVVPGVWLDYAHTPQALEAALADLRARTKGLLGVVFGCGGERDRAKRPQMGRIAASRADCVWITTDNPRGESPQAIAAEILAGVPRKLRSKVRVQLDRARAIEEAVQELAHRGALLVAGKGVEEVIEIGDARLPWSDAEAIRRAWRRMQRCA